jgi:glycosyltransferase involved in cell wall biosynthesis
MISNSNCNSGSRICILIGGYFPFVGGGESHAKLLAEYLKEENVSVLVLTRRRISNTKYFEYIGKVPVYRIPPPGLKRWGKYLMLAPALIWLIYLRNRYDIIYVCGQRVLGVVGVISAKLLNKRCILRSESCGELSGDFIWTTTAINRKSIFGILIKRFLLIRNEVLKKANCFISISRAITEEFLKNGIDSKKIVEIPNGIDINKFKPNDKDGKASLRKRCNIPLKTIFTYTGKLNKGKGLELILRVWNTITQTNKNVHLLLVGSGDNQHISCETELRSYIHANHLEKHVTITGYVDNVQEYLQCSDYFLFPSESEAFGISIIEALACELPVITTNVDGIVDIIEHRENGLLINVNDEQGLKENILWCLENPEKAKILGINGRNTVQQRYSIDTIAEKHLKTFLDIKKPA